MSKTTPSPHPRTGAERPLSPHLQIYTPLFTMMMSIMHRITGVTLYFGMALLALWLMAAASGESEFARIGGFVGSWFGQIVLFGFTWALLHHMLGGLRHFIWDTAHGLEKFERETLAKATLAGSVILTPVIWFIGYMVR